MLRSWRLGTLCLVVLAISLSVIHHTHAGGKGYGGLETILAAGLLAKALQKKGHKKKMIPIPVPMHQPVTKFIPIPIHTSKVYHIKEGFDGGYEGYGMEGGFEGGMEGGFEGGFGGEGFDGGFGGGIEGGFGGEY